MKKFTCERKNMSKNNKKYFGTKICQGCNKPATVLSCTETGNKQLCDACLKKLLDKPFNGLNL